MLRIPVGTFMEPALEPCMKVQRISGVNGWWESCNAVSYTHLETVRDYRKMTELSRIVNEMDYIIFASSSAVKAFASMSEFEKIDRVAPKVICIGPVTRDTAVSYTHLQWRQRNLWDGRHCHTDKKWEKSGNWDRGGSGGNGCYSCLLYTSRCV